MLSALFGIDDDDILGATICLYRIISLGTCFYFLDTIHLLRTQVSISGKPEHGFIKYATNAFMFCFLGWFLCYVDLFPFCILWEGIGILLLSSIYSTMLILSSIYCTIIFVLLSTHSGTCELKLLAGAVRSICVCVTTRTAGTSSRGLVPTDVSIVSQ